jgi:tetratricopeptide (TPR) repeat protein
MLIVLDNAADSNQVRALLPGTPTCCVVVTSRNSLAGLVARDGARRIDLDVLPLAEAKELLERLLGDRLDAEVETVTELAERCDRLPLALRIVAERAANRPELSLAELVAELDDENHRLDALQADERVGVRTVFSWSLRQLEAAVLRLFRLLGLHPGVDIDAYAAAALADTSVEDVAGMIHALRRAYLVQSSGPHRIAMHDLVRAYAADLAESEDDREGALSRLFDFYLHTAGAAMDVFLPGTPRRPATKVTGLAIPVLAEPAAGLGWLQAEQANLVALSGYAARHGWHSFVIGLSSTIWVYLRQHNADFHVARSMHEHALQAARATGDHAAEAEALTNLGRVLYRWDQLDKARDAAEQAGHLLAETGDRIAAAYVTDLLGRSYFSRGLYPEAAEHLHESLAVFREIGDRFSEVASTGRVAMIDECLGHYDSALAGYRRALQLSEEIGDGEAAALWLGQVALLLSRQGHHDKALEEAERARALAREAGSITCEALAINMTGYILSRLGRRDEALALHQEALDFNRLIGMPSNEAHSLNGIGLVDLAYGRPAEAVLRHNRALEICRGIGDEPNELDTLNHLGVALHAAGDSTQAVRRHRQAAALARAMGDRYELARALHGTAVALQTQGEITDAEQHLAEARALYRELGLPEADQIAL